MENRSAHKICRSSRLMLAAVAIACFLLGYQATIAQVIIVREFLVIFFGNELCLGVIFSSWFVGIAVGAYIASRKTDRIKDPLPVLVISELLFPVMLLCFLPPIRISRGWLGAGPGELIPFVKLVAATALMVVPISFIIGFTFPFACCVMRAVRRSQPSGETESIGWVYALESSGSLVGGVLFSFVLVQHLSTPAIAFISIIVVSACLSLLTLSVSSKSRIGRILTTCTGIITLVSIVSLALGLSGKLDKATVLARWRSMGQKLELVASRDSKYQNLALGVQEGQHSLFANGQYTFSFPDPYIPAQKANLFMCEHPSPHRVLLIGGTPGMLHEILRYPVISVDYLEIDPEVLRIVEPYLSPTEKDALADSRVQVFYEDGRHFVKHNRGKRGYDLVILNLPDPSTATLNRFYTKEFFEEVKEVLQPGGVVITGISSTSTYFGEEMARFSGSLFVTLRDSFRYLAIAPGEQNYFFATDTPDTVTESADILAKRYESRALTSQYFSKYLFASIFQPERIRFTWQSFESAAGLRINTDDTPITYFFNLILWSRYSGGKFGPVLMALSKTRFLWVVVTVVVIFVLCAGLPLIRVSNRRSLGRPVALIAIGTTGIAAMAFDLTALYAYQSIYGYLYQEMGLVVALFMTGLALGSILATRALAKRSARSEIAFLALEIAIALFAIALPGLLHGAASLERFALGKSFFLVIVAGAGAVTGAMFPVANAVFMRAGGSMGKSAALTESIDNAGAAIGAFVTGVLLLPVFGTLNTCVLLCAINLLSAALIALWLALRNRQT